MRRSWRAWLPLIAELYRSANAQQYFERRFDVANAILYCIVLYNKKIIMQDMAINGVISYWTSISKVACCIVRRTTLVFRFLCFARVFFRFHASGASFEIDFRYIRHRPHLVGSVLYWRCTNGGVKYRGFR